jgi:DNA polymerase-3 subunit gamma/tau
MMKLMSDLISYLRDLLVYKVKPEALSDDVDTDSEKSLAAQSALIETDRLLELIDGFAEAEGRMKWAPNKKLHFEVALIKAIQMLGQVTLNEVIEKLNALRDGKSAPTPEPLPSKVVAGDASPARTADPGRGNNKKSAAPAKPPEVTAAAPEPAPKPAKAEGSPDPAKLWEEVCAKIPARGFLRTLVDSLAVVGAEGRAFTLGYPPSEKSAIETLATTSNRRQLENLLREISGQDWSIKFEGREGLPARKANDQASARAQEYKDDPLIQEALEMFKGEIRS